MKIVVKFICLTILVLVPVHSALFAKDYPVTAGKGEKQSYIVVLDDLPLASYDGRLIHTPERSVDSISLPATATSFTSARKLDVNSPASQQYLQFLDERFESFRGEALLRLGHRLEPKHRYRNAVNGFAMELSEAGVRSLRGMPGVKSVQFDEVQRLHSDSGPAWIGADKVHDGSAGVAANGGEGVVVGIIDSGINWDHPSFADPGEGKPIDSGNWDHVNPYGTGLGLCQKPGVHCNDKLVGVYDLVEDNFSTEVVEENNNGKDNAGHGSLVASVAAGNPVTGILNGIRLEMAGVAPNANIISYRVCFIGSTTDADDDGCQTSAILRAIDQALADGVDVINHSIGGDAHDPWLTSTSAFAFLNLRTAGIFVATSAGNAGSEPGTMGSPGNAPWITAVGAATHDRVFASAVENLSGGSTPPPETLVGASSTGGIGITRIVHAKDYGNALCGTGTPELQPGCSGNTGKSSPFQPGTFNGEIVVCDRGIYGRVEKSKNVQLAGAGAYILANSEDGPDTRVSDVHCVPGLHLNLEDGNRLRNWLDQGAGHQGSISGFSKLNIPEAGDVMAAFSSRGPNLSPANGVMKPEIIAPGVDILGASHEGNGSSVSNGTSFSSPHVAGGAALIKAVHPDWTPSMISSALVTTATPGQAIDFDGNEATLHIRGAGRPRLDQAVRAGLFLNQTEHDFIVANPNLGGDPSRLNLPALIDPSCSNSCEFTRTVTDMAGGASWHASVEGLSADVSVAITPNTFTLANGASQALSIDIDLSGLEPIGEWIFGSIRLSSNGLPDAVLPLAIFVSGGDLPSRWMIRSDRPSGWQEFPLTDLINLPDATYTTGGLVEPVLTTENLPEDPDHDSPYDGPEGLMTVWHTVPEDTLWLHAETLASSSEDLDMFVGLDLNQDGKAQESEEICTSTSPIDIEACDLFTPAAGEYWIIVQNWSPGNALDEVTLKTAVVGKNTMANLTATGDGIVAAAEDIKVRLSWDNVSAVPGTELVGAVGLGTSRDQANNIGIIPVRFEKSGVEAPGTLVLMDSVSRGVALDAGARHDRIVLDIPPGISAFTVSANSADDAQNPALEMELYRMDFDAAFTAAPFAVVPMASGDPLVAGSGSDAGGPSLTVGGANVVPGRWYVVLNNTSAIPADIEVRAELTYAGTPVVLKAGLWQPSSRPDLSQGYDYASTGGYRALLWYTYDEDGNPAWYLASGPEPAGNVWVAELYRFTNDGDLQQETAVGQVSVTTLAEQDSVFSFVLFGEEGSDRMMPSSPPLCPMVNNAKRSYTGIWSRQAVGVGGSSVLVSDGSQAYLHYAFDARGKPVWLLGAGGSDGLPHAEIPLSQFNGFCAVCSGSEPTSQEVGLFTLDYNDEDSANWNLNYVLESPLEGTIDRSDDADKLTLPLVCQ